MGKKGLFEFCITEEKGISCKLLEISNPCVGNVRISLFSLNQVYFSTWCQKFLLESAFESSCGLRNSLPGEDNNAVASTALKYVK